MAASISRNKGVDLESLSDDVMFEEMINQNYKLMEAANIELDTLIQSAQVDLEEKKMFYQELLTESEAINQYYTSGVKSDLKNDSLDIIRSLISINKTASYNEAPVSPNKVMILSISVVLGLMLGVFVAFFGHYWKQA
jgi:LPS O-antigen subunit length determinant protein (WzzB/FepE family)